MGDMVSFPSNDQIKSVADRRAREGFVAPAPDLYRGAHASERVSPGARGYLPSARVSGRPDAAHACGPPSSTATWKP
jgi:dienelactone hydrolase